jgi:hypothetical protein
MSTIDSIDVSGDYDFLVAELPGLVDHRVTVFGESNGRSLPDPRVFIFDENFNYIGTQDDSQFGLDVFYKFQTTYNGLYYFAVGDATNGTGTYEFSLNFEGLPTTSLPNFEEPNSELYSIDFNRKAEILGSAGIEFNPSEDTDESEDSTEDSSPGSSVIELFRFRNTNFDTGTYVFVGETEKNNILNDSNYNQTFELEGGGNPSFVASTEPGEGLSPFYRLASADAPGSYLFVGSSEYDAIFAENSDQRDKWIAEGLAESGDDSPEFYLLDGSINTGIEFNRFQNLQNGTFLYAGPEETENIESNPDLLNVFYNQGFAFGSL